MGWTAPVIHAAPGVDVDIAVGCDSDVASVTDRIGENRRAESGGKGEAAIVPRASVVVCATRLSKRL